MSQVMGFELNVVGVAKLNFRNSHHAEQVLRGLVHSGYAICITEKPVDIPTQAIENEKWEQEQEQVRNKHYQNEKLAEVRRRNSNMTVPTGVHDLLRGDCDPMVTETACAVMAVDPSDNRHL